MFGVGAKSGVGEPKVLESRQRRNTLQVRGKQHAPRKPQNTEAPDSSLTAA